MWYMARYLEQIILSIKIQEIQDISEADIDKLYQEVNKVSSRYDEYVKLFTETRTEFNKIKMMLLTLKEKE